tara:strand:+ start:168 stop:803 length:636 start_codon:yes stop_codon:yes gene_type:complete
MLSKVNNLITKEARFPLNQNDYKIIGDLIKEGQPGSVLACLSQDLITKYIEISIKSENLFFYICEHDNRIVGYALWAKDSSFLTSEFQNIKYSVLTNLLTSFKIKAIINIFLSIFKIEFLLLSSDKRNFINKNLIFTLMAFEKESQSKGMGTVFCSQMFSDLNKRYNFQTMIVEPYDKRAIYFFKNKFNCKYLGKKIRLFKNLEIYYKNLS